MILAQHKRPLLAGVLLAPALSVLGLFALYSAQLDSWTAWLLFYGVALFGIAILGVPIALYLRKHGLLAWIPLLGCATLAGNLYYQILGIFLSDGPSLETFMVGSFAGFLAGIGFCLGAWPTRILEWTPQ